MGDLIRVAGKEELQPGQCMKVRVSNQDLALFNVDGKFYAIDDMCPHAGGPLSEGFIDGESVICPWHGWEFNVKSGACRVVGLEQKTYPVQVEGDDILVSTEPSPIEDPADEEVTKSIEATCGQDTQTQADPALEFVRVAAEGEIENGRSKVCEINRRHVAVYNVEGKHHAIDDYCPHAGGSLSDGWVEKNCAVCPLHGYEFSLENGESPYGYINDTFEVKVENGEVFVCTTPRPDPTKVEAASKEIKEEPAVEPEQAKTPGGLTFIRVAAVCELEEKRGKFVEAGKKKVALFKVAEEIYAVDDICPHMGAPLSDGFVEGKSVMCGWHAWEFSLENGECPFGMSIPTYQVKIDGDDVLVGVEA
ncbi:MAG: Rieske 2Fe-2S domain-containing protein [Planctomycetota bacterium]|nr:Rieske 2Fe-2S domain-containing protein [Planctomycetota bacterium]